VLWLSLVDKGTGFVLRVAAADASILKEFVDRIGGMVGDVKLNASSRRLYVVKQIFEHSQFVHPLRLELSDRSNPFLMPPDFQARL
jgi:hypothetical protein